ncbi:uncharacterized protein LOC119669099 isoform X2 [Teleopsis dalmanni]|uniref:uncharacterized protein LOC119669099 isoform X2 n=1 Tax=Teleopsis dalmanni TaxID=139649 RepID=UPI0018CC95F9|nr:uncharacterized protein LOC119669099 isoform X2 [Teleopsis dalmanni]
MYGPMLPDRYVPEIPGLPQCEDEVINRFNEGLQDLMDEEEQNKVCEEKDTSEVYEPYRPTTCQEQVLAVRQGVTDRFNEGLYSLMEQEIEEKGCEDMGPQMEAQMDAEVEVPQNYEAFAMTTCKDQLAAVRQGLTDNFNQGLQSLMEQENQDNACQEPPPPAPPSPEICEPDMYKYSCRNDAMRRRQACSNRFHEGLQDLIEKEERAKACMPKTPVKPEPPTEPWKTPHILTRRDMDIQVRNDFMRGPTMEERQEMMKYESAPRGKRAASDIAYQQRFQRRMTNQLDLISQGMDNLTRNRFQKPRRPKPCPQVCPPQFQWPKIDSNIENLDDITIDLVGSSAEGDDMCE